MKLLFASAAVLLAVLAEAATTTKSLNLKGTSVRRALDKHKIMEKAIPVNRKGERLLNQNFELTGAYSLQFNKCISLPMEADEDGIMFADDLLSYTAQGEIVTQKSYILFNVCPTKYCSYYASDDNLYMVDLATYMDSIVDFYMDRNDAYCGACQEAEEYCAFVKYTDGSGGSSQSSSSSAANQGSSSYANNGNADADAATAQDDDITHYNNYNYYKNKNNGYWAQQQKQYENYVNEEQQQEINNKYYNYQYYNKNNNGYWSQQAKQYYQYQQNGGRQLQQNNGLQVIDCGQCEAWNCFQAEEDVEYENEEQAAYANSQVYHYYDSEAQQYQDIEVDLDQIADWVQEIVECKQTDALLLDIYPTYAGFMCNQDGSGVDIAVFLDEECSVYTSLLNYKKGAAKDLDKIYMYEAKDMIQHTFLNPVNCNANVEYVTPDEYKYRMQNYYAQGNNNRNENPEAVEFCQALFDANAVPLKDCDTSSSSSSSSSSGQYVNQYYDETYEFYHWMISQEDAEDNEAVCGIVGSLQGEYNYVYRWADSGQVYDYGTHTQSTSSSSNVMSFFNQYSDKMSPGMIAAVALAAAIAMFSAFCICLSCCCWSKPNVDVTDMKRKMDEKSERLVDASTGKLI